MSSAVISRVSEQSTELTIAVEPMQPNATPCNVFSNSPDDPPTPKEPLYPSGPILANQESHEQPFRRDSQLAARPVDMPQLSQRQQRAIELLVLGQAECHIANVIGVDRCTLWRWKKHHPLFKAELSRRREALWEAAADRFRQTLFSAVKILRKQLHHEQAMVQFRAARALLTLAGSDCFAPPDDPTDPNEYLNAFALARRNEIHEPDFQKEPATDTERKSALATLLAQAGTPMANSYSERGRNADGADFADEMRSEEAAQIRDKYQGIS